jgi:hypothetical protein
MSRTHAARRLLEHGPLTFGELLEITGWPLGSLKCAIARLMERGEVVPEHCGPHRNVYRLA